jgi:tetratricopeptide (TPR) repeat protein
MPLRIVALVLLSLVTWPSTATAQKDLFFETIPQFYRALAGVYGDEGPQISAHLETLSTALVRWDLDLGAAELQLRPRLKGADTRTALEVHTILASLYAERSRFSEALRELDEVIRIDPNRAVFHRFRALAYRAAGRPEDAAKAYRTAWLVDGNDPQNAYQLLVHKTDDTTPADVERALRTLGETERRLVTGQQPKADAPFLTVSAVNDDVGSAMPFAPSAYARPLSLLLEGRFDPGMTALRAAVMADPLIADAASGSETMRRGIAALRQGNPDVAIKLLLTAVTAFPQSSEAHRVLATAYGVNANIAESVHHLREAVRLNPRDERAWLALARTLDATGDVEGSMTVLRSAVLQLPDAGAVRWMMSVLSAKRRRTEDVDLELVAIADRLVLVAGRGEFYGRVAALAQGHLDYDRAIALLRQRVALTPNNAAAHRALGAAYADQGREDEAYAELVIALLLEPADAETLTTLGRLHLSAGRAADAVEVLERAAALAPTEVETLQALGDALVRAGRVEDGQKRLQDAERLVGAAVEEQRRRRNVGMLVAQAELQVIQKLHVEAVETWKQVIELEGAAANRLQLAAAYAAANRLDEAADALQSAISLNAGPEAHRRLAEVYAALGRREESEMHRRTYIDQRLQELRQRTADRQTP